MTMMHHDKDGGQCCTMGMHHGCMMNSGCCMHGGCCSMHDGCCSMHEGCKMDGDMKDGKCKMDSAKGGKCCMDKDGKGKMEGKDMDKMHKDSAKGK